MELLENQDVHPREYTKLLYFIEYARKHDTICMRETRY